MTIPLDGPRLPPPSGTTATSLIILLHGYGSNGADMIALAPLWQPLLPETAFVAPDAPGHCRGAPGGRQWWSLASFDRAALAAGARRAAPALDQFIDTEVARLGLAPARVLLAGFSQGTMMALHVGLRRPYALGGVIGFSGMLADAALRGEDVTSRPPIQLIHGDADPVVPVRGSREAEAQLRALGLDVYLHVSRGLGHSVDAEGLTIAAAFARKCLADG